MRMSLTVGLLIIGIVIWFFIPSRDYVAYQERKRQQQLYELQQRIQRERNAANDDISDAD
jgi:hypothetical protein